MSKEIIANAFQKGFSFWNSLSGSDKSFLLEQTLRVHVSKGTNIYSFDEKYFGIFLLYEGSLRTYFLSEGGRDITLYRLSNGEVGHILANGVLSNIEFEVHIETEQDCIFFLIPPEPFLSVSNRNESVQLFTCRLALSRCASIIWTMQEILFFSFDRRLASFLIDESVRNGSNTIVMTHDQIAKYVGSSREVVSRMLKTFEARKYIQLNRGSVRITDKARLRTLTHS